MRRLPVIRSVDPWALGAAALIATAMAIMLYTFLDYGLTYDEDGQHAYATCIWRWYMSGGRDDAALNFRNLMYYGAFFELLAEVGARSLPWGTYEGRHFVNVLFALVGVVGTYRLARLVDTSRAGFLAVLFLLATPEFYGHSFNNPKDIPVAVLSVWALFAILSATKDLPLRWRHVLGAAIPLGLLLAVRAGMIFHFGYLVLAWVGSLTLWHWNARTESRAFIRDFGRLGAQACVALCGAWVLMLVFWPFGQVKPIENPIRAIVAAARFPWNNPVRFQGMDVLARELPRTYLPVEIGVRLPEFLLFALVCGLMVLVARRAWSRLVPRNTQALHLFFLVLAVLFPIGSAIVLRSTVYDGMRHFIFILPPLSVLGAIGFSRFLDLSIIQRLRLRVPAAAVLAVAVCAVMWDMVALHPYQSVYFNRLFAGGLRGGAGSFETDYWGASYREAAEWVFRNYAPYSDSQVTIRNCSADFLTRYWIEKDPALKAHFTIGSPGETPNVFLATERWQCHQVKGGKLLHVVRRQGVPLTYVYELRRPSAPDPSVSAAVRK